MNINPMFNPMMNPLANPANLMNMMKQPPPMQGEYKKVWVGHIPPGTSDAFILRLLDTCGTVSSWKRTTDQQDRPKGFGLCEYTTVESMLKCLRLLNYLKLEEGYELSVSLFFIIKFQIKVDSKTEEFLKQWREQKKQEWIDSLKRRGIDVNLDEIKKKENNKEPLEWELQLISKDNEARKLILEILSQRNEIENTSRQKERPEEFLKDLKDLTTSSNPFSQHFESEREKKRQKKKIEKIEKKEKYYKEDLKKWERHEEERERELIKEIQEQEELIKKKKKLLEKDLNYDSEEEKKKIKLTPKKVEEYKQMREKEKEMDEIMHLSEKQAIKQENTLFNINEDVKDVAIYGPDGRMDLTVKEPEAKATVTIQEYKEDYESEGEDSNISRRNIMSLDLNLNIETKKQIPKMIEHFDYDNEDPLHKKEKLTHLEINPETEKEILEMKREIFFEKKEEKKESEVIPVVVNSAVTGNPQKMIEIQKQIFEMIPKSKEDLFKFSIDWSVVYKYNILENKIKPWIGKKLKEYIGEDEPNLVAMIIKKLGNKASPYEIMEKIKVVFDEDTEVLILIFYIFIQDFMIKLWKTFVFEILKAKKIYNI